MMIANPRPRGPSVRFPVLATGERGQWGGKVVQSIDTRVRTKMGHLSWAEGTVSIV